MTLDLQSFPSTANSIIGQLFIDGYHFCYTLEDVYRRDPNPLTKENEAKVDGETAIPAGRYQVIVNKSERFSRKESKRQGKQVDVFMPLLLDVPGFKGVRIHTGNFPRDTEGCILVGLERGPDMISDSRKAYAALLLKIKEAIAKGEEVWINITRAEERQAVGA